MGALDTKFPASHCADGYLKFNLDTGAAVTAYPQKWFEGHEGKHEDGSHKGYVTASGERISDYGGVKLQCTDENSMVRNITGRLTDVHK
eukprot:1967675-Pyramimonas_sp.AAC.1